MDFIVELGNTHEGSLGIATSLVDMAYVAGATTVKFQMHLAEHEGTPTEPFRTSFSKQDISRQEYWRRVNFSEEEWLILADYVSSKSMEFLCTPFSVEAASFLFEHKLVRRWKVGSGDASNFPLLEFLSSTGLPLIISTGLVSWDEILDLRNFLNSRGVWDKTTLMHCVSSYPVSLDRISMNVIDDLRALGCRVGYSDHSGNVSAGLLAVSKGVECLEIHMTPHRLFFGPDVTSSLLPEEVALLIRICQDWQTMSANPHTRDDLYGEVTQTASLFRKGIYWASDMGPGMSIQLKDLKFLKPSHEFDAIDYQQVIKSRVARQVLKGQPVQRGDLDLD